MDTGTEHDLGLNVSGSPDVSRETGDDLNLLGYRLERFKVEVSPTRNAEFENQTTISITFNGYQWTSLSLLPVEIDKIVSALSKHRLSQSKVSTTASGKPK